MIDKDARAKLEQRIATAQAQRGFSQVVEAIKGTGQNNQVVQDLITQLVTLNNKFESQMVDKLKVLSDAFQKNSLTTEQLQNLKFLIDTVNDKMAVFEEIKGKIDQGQTILLPKEMQLSGEVAVSEIKKLPPVALKEPIIIPPFPKQVTVDGEVDIASLPPVTINNLRELAAIISNLQSATLEAMKALKVKIPESFTVTNEVKINAWEDLIDGIEELKKGFNLLINKEAATVSFPSTSIPVEVQNWKISQPVTHVSLNALNGSIVSTQTSVLTQATPLPGSNLSNRRSLIVYNNSTQTIYIGGSTVTVANGLPVPKNTYSPPMDAGVNVTVYGIAATAGGADCRVLEISDESSGR